MEKSVEAQLVEFAVQTKIADIPKETLEFTKFLTLKTVSGMLAGSVTPSAQKVAGLIREQRHPEEVGVIGSSFRTTLWEAVFLGAYFAHAKELEDDRYVEGVSWDITVIPLLLPLAEKLGLSGRALLEALAIGLEVHTRTCMFGTQHVGLFVVPGAVGPAVAAAKALKLSIPETSAALGLALSGVPLSMVNFGSDAHYFESSLHSLQGIMAAQMAKVGLSGNPELGTYLVRLLGSNKVDPQRMTEDLGKRWVLREIQVKKFPCCLANHRQIDLVLELREKHHLSFEDVEVIELHSRRQGDIRNNRPDPKTEQDLQFSFQHNLGVAMLDGDVSVEHFTPEAVGNPKYREARSKVKFIPAPESAPVDTLEEPACVVIKTKDGRELRGERKFAIGSFQEPLKMDQFRNLYRKFTRGILSEKEVLRSEEMILNLETLNDLHPLMDSLRVNV